MSEAIGIAPGMVLLGKYRVESTIGSGGMGLVYRAHHLQLDEVVAIKVLRSDLTLDHLAVTRFQQEARAAVKLKSEHVARILDVGVFDDETPYMVMEFLTGADLDSMLNHHGAMAIPEVVDWMLQICDALAEAHSIGIVHRDIKPSNLFLTERDGTHLVKVLDFGISKSAAGTDLSLTQTASVLGTPAYMSPEQMRSARRVDARSDIWSLGTVLYELVEGRRPFRAENFSEMCLMAAMDPYDPMTVAPQLDPIIARCMAKDPEDRYPTIADLAAALVPFAGDRERASHYVARARRVLGRAAASHPDLLVAGAGPVSARGGLATTVVSVDARPKKRVRAIVLAALVVAIAGAATYIAIDRSRQASDRSIEVTPVTPVTPPTVVADPVPVPSPPPIGSAGSDEGSAVPVAVVAPPEEPVAGNGSAKKKRGRTTKSDSQDKTTAKGSDGSAAIKPAPEVKAGSAVEAGSSAPCDPMLSRGAC